MEETQAQPQQVQPVPVQQTEERERWREERRKYWEERHRREDALQAKEAQQEKDTHPVPNDVPWYFLGGSILVGAALLSYGMTMTIKKWATDLQSSSSHVSKATVVANIFSIIIASGLGTLIGHLTWHWGLGLTTGFVGAWGSNWILDHIGSFLSRWKAPPSPPKT